MFLEKIEIGHVLPCLADPEKLRFVAYLERDISGVLPYLNALLEGAIYNHEGGTLTIKKGGRLISLHPRKIAGGKLLDLEDINRTLEWLRGLINHCSANRETIEPNFERRQRLTALDVYKLLPGKNCRQCGAPTCLAFAVKLAQEQAGAMGCRPLFSGDFGDKRAELFRLLQSSGYRVPGAFAEVEEDKL